MATMTTSGAVILKAGANVSSSLTTEYDDWILMAESAINSLTRYNWTDAYAGLNADVQKVLDDAASCYAAMYAINYDMSGYTSRTEAETMLDLLRDMFNRLIKQLEEIKHQDFITGA